MSGNLYGGTARRSGKRVNRRGRGVTNFLDVIHCAINPRVCDDFVYNGPMTGEGTALDGDRGCNSTLNFQRNGVEMRDTYVRTRETINTKYIMYMNVSSTC